MSNEDFHDEDKRKLEFPYLLSIPYKVASEKKLCPNAKIHYGCLVALSKKMGYCWATNTQLAEMHDVNECQIKEWLKALESFGFIEREQIHSTYRDESGRLLWKKRRKIWVDKAFSSQKENSKKDSDRGEKPPIDDRRENPPITKNKPFKYEKVNEAATPSMPLFNKGGFIVSPPTRQTSMPKKKYPPKDFYLALPPDQKELHDRILDEAAARGQLVDSKAITAWLKKWGRERVENVLEFYLQEVQKAKKRGSQIGSMGGFMRGALNKDLKATTLGSVRNKQYAEEMKANHRFLEVLGKYVRVSENLEFYYTMSEEQFHRALSEACDLAGELNGWV